MFNFLRRKKVASITSVDDIVLKLLDKAEADLSAGDFLNAYSLLQRADRFYERGGFNIEVEERLNRALRSYGEKFPFTWKD